MKNLSTGLFVNRMTPKVQKLAKFEINKNLNKEYKRFQVH